MEQQTGSKSVKEWVKVVYCHPAYLTYMQGTSACTGLDATQAGMLGLMKHKVESRLLGEISITSDTQMTPSIWQRQRRTKEPLVDNEKGE